MSNVLIEKDKLDILANAISNKSGEPLKLTLDEMVEAVDGIETGGGTPTLETVTKTYTPSTSAVTDTITPSTGYDGIEEVDVTVSAVPTGERGIPSWSKSKASTTYILIATFPNVTAGYISSIPAISTTLSLENKAVEPTENQQTVEPTDIGCYLNSVTVNAIPSNYVGSGITQRSSSDLTVSGATVTAPSGYYSASASKSVASGTAGTPTATKGTVSNHSVSVTPSVTNTTGYITGSTKTGTAVSVSASELVSGTLSVTSNGTKDVTNYASISVNVPTGSTINNQDKTVSPTESTQYVTADSDYTGLGTVTVNAISSTYVGSGITRRSSTDLTTSSATVTVPAGYYAEQASKAVATMTLPTTYSETAFGSPIINIEPSETVRYLSIAPGYLTNRGYYTINAVSSTYVGSGVTQRDSDDLTVSGATITAPAGYYSDSASKSVSSLTLPTTTSSSATSGYTKKATIGRSTAAQYINIGTGYNSAGGYYEISAVANGSATAPASISGTSASVTTGTNTLTLSKTISVTPTVTAGYISSGTAGNSSVSLTASIPINPTPTASGATVTIPTGYYSSQTTKSVSSGSASAPTSISGTTATVSTGTNTLTLTKTVSVTPVVSAGYVSSGTATNSSVSLTASVTTKAAATYHPSTTAQSISSGTYLTGAQTIAAVTTSNLSASNIVSGVTIKVGDSSDDDCVASVTGSVVLQNYYTGSSVPSSSTGSNGDLYLQS